MAMHYYGQGSRTKEITSSAECRNCMKAKRQAHLQENCLALHLLGKLLIPASSDSEQRLRNFSNLKESITRETRGAWRCLAVRQRVRRSRDAEGCSQMVWRGLVGGPVISS